MSTETKTFETLQQLKEALPSLPDDAVFRDRDGDTVLRSSLPLLLGKYAPYTVMYEAPTTPAPLDPSKVTVEITDWEDFRPGDVVVQNPDADRVEGAAFLVERHQPAPEPEPEWKPGTTGTATLNNLVSGLSSVDLRAMRTLRDGVYGFAFANGLSITDDATTYSVSDFVPDEPRPLPTRDQVSEAMETRFREARLEGYGPFSYHATNAVMSLLGGDDL